MAALPVSCEPVSVSVIAEYREFTGNWERLRPAADAFTRRYPGIFRGLGPVSLFLKNRETRHPKQGSVPQEQGM